MPKGPWFSKEQIQSVVAGLSGADRTGATPQAGLDNPDGTPAASVMQQLRALVARGAATASDLLALIQTVDGAGSGLDADSVDGFDSAAFAPAAHRHDNATTAADGFHAKEDKARVHERLHGVSSQDHSDVKNAPQDTQVLVFRLAGPQGLGFYWESPGAATVPSADETQEGKSRQATAQQIVDGAAGNLFATVARLKAELDRRQTLGAGFFLTANGPTIFNGVNIPADGNQISADLRGLGGIPTDARAVTVSVFLGAQGGARTVYVDSADAPNAAVRSPRCIGSSVPSAGQYTVALGQAQAGRIKISAGAINVLDVSVYVTGWWR